MNQYAASVAWVLCVLTCSGVESNTLPLWKTQLTHFRSWKGYYIFNDISHACRMNVHSVNNDEGKGTVVSFTADEAELDMTVFSQDDIAIVFQKETVYHPGDHFYDDFEFVMELIQSGRMYIMLGNITKPTSNFSTIRLQPDVSGATNHMQSSKLSVGLSVGISITLFIVCVVIGIVILRWAIKKGYLRHVARSYKSFRNPETADTSVTFSNTQTEAQGEEVNVHM